MHILPKIAIYQIGCVFLFSMIYFNYKDHFVRDVSNRKGVLEPNYIDCLLLSSTIQAAIGYTDLYPITTVSKIILIVQQFVMIFTYIYLLYAFTG